MYDGFVVFISPFYFHRNVCSSLSETYSHSAFQAADLRFLLVVIYDTRHNYIPNKNNQTQRNMVRVSLVWRRERFSDLLYIFKVSDSNREAIFSRKCPSAVQRDLRSYSSSSLGVLTLQMGTNRQTILLYSHSAYSTDDGLKQKQRNSFELKLLYQQNSNRTK